MVFSTRGRCNDVEQGYKAWTKNVFAKSRPVPTFRHFSGIPIASMPVHKIFVTLLSLVKYNYIVLSHLGTVNML